MPGTCDDRQDSASASLDLAKSALRDIAHTRCRSAGNAKWYGHARTYPGTKSKKGLQEKSCNPFDPAGRSDRIRTYDPLIPNQMRYQAALRSD